MEKANCSVCPFKSMAVQKLTIEELRLMENNCATTMFKAGENIVRQGALSTNIVYIQSGLVKIHVNGPIRERIQRITKGSSYLCLPGSFGDKINRFSATALEQTKVCFIDITTFKLFVQKNGTFAWQIIQDLSQADMENMLNCLNTAQKQAIGKVADAILLFSERIYHSDHFKLPISRQDLADLTGTTRESICRILADFNEEQIVELKSRYIRILDKSRLQQIGDRG
jgi:CRP-like cAMP-binding protein